MLDSPVSGGPRGRARPASSRIWVGGDEQMFERYKPVLDAIGDQARYIGPIGAGSVAKLVHNCAGYCDPGGAGRGVHDGRQGRGRAAGAVGGGAPGRASAGARTFDGLIDQFLPGKYEPPAFALRLAHKDMTLATAARPRVQRADARRQSGARPK